jgi:hypothetical protein
MALIPGVTALAAASATGSLRVSTENPRYFTDGENKPFNQPYRRDVFPHARHRDRYLLKRKFARS